MHRSVALALALVAPAAHAFQMTTPIPPEITTPATVETHLGTLEFFDGLPTDQTIRIVYDNLDRQRAVEVFLDMTPAASLVAMRRGLREVGAVDGTIGVWKERLDAKSLLLTGNTESIYATTWLDTRNGPIVIESPPNVLGVIDDFWFRYVADLGNAGPDKGKGGKFLLLPPGYTGKVPSGYFVLKSPTYNNWLIWRGFLVKGDASAAIAGLERQARVYPLSEAGRSHPPRLIDLSGRAFNTIHANDATFFSEVAEVIQEEPTSSFSPELLGMAASIGIDKNKPFAPDARMQKLLAEAAAIGNATARAITFASRDPSGTLFPGTRWKSAFLGGSYEWLQNGHRYLDARTAFFYAATVNTPAMVVAMPGVGSQYATAMRDAGDAWLDGGRTYRLRIPANPPAKNFWSIVAYDPQTRSLLQTDQRFPSLNSDGDIVANADGTIDVFFGPTAPAGREKNWIQTVPAKGWFPIFRLYGPLQPWFDKTWSLPDIERLDGGAS